MVQKKKNKVITDRLEDEDKTMCIIKEKHKEDEIWF